MLSHLPGGHRVLGSRAWEASNSLLSEGPAPGLCAANCHTCWSTFLQVVACKAAKLNSINYFLRQEFKKIKNSSIFETRILKF